MEELDRRLAGILAADVVGYAAMVGADEPGALARVRALRRNVIEPLATTHGGRLFKTTGDGFLVAFPSVVRALGCAIAIQDALRARADALRLRIGVHQGEVVPEGDDLLGDGVIVAARLETLAEPGGICISGRVGEDAAGKFPFDVDDLGIPTLKNIAQPIRVYRVRGIAAERPAPPLPDMPSPAVARFYVFGPFRLDTRSDTLVGPHGPVALGQRACALLRALVSQPGVLITKSELMDAAWPDLAVEEGNLTVQISALRKTLAETPGAGQWIATVARRGYRFIGEVQGSDSLPAPRINNLGSTGPANTDRPSVAILPFENAGAEPGDSYISDGVTADIIIALSRFSGLLVIAANSSFRYRGDQVDIRTVAQDLGVQYVVQGSVRHSGDRIRISVQLIEASTGTHRWADRYECAASDVFAVQDEVTGCIVGVLVAQLTKAERDRTLRKPPESWRAYDLYLRATDRSRQWDREAFAAGERWLEQAIALDPNFAPAYALLAECHVSAWIEPKDNRYQDPATLDAAWRLAQAAMERDPLLPAAHAAFGNILHWRGETDEAIRAYERALELNPNSAQHFYGNVLLIAGRPLEGLGVFQRSMRLDPFFAPMLLGHVGHCYIMLGNDRAALAPLRECAARAPGWRPAYVWLAAACMRLGLVNEARSAAARVLEIDPNFSIDAWRRLHPYRDPAGAERMYEALRSAGLPDRSPTSMRFD